MGFWRYVYIVGGSLVCGYTLAIYHLEGEHSEQPVSMSSTGFSIDTRVQNIYKTLRDGYFYDDRIDESAMKNRAVKSYVNGLKDPYTVYLDKQEHKDLSEGLTGEEDFEGIGAKVIKNDQGVLIDEVLKGSPALKAGLKPLDIVVAINGTGVLDDGLSDSIKRMRGPKGTIVELTVWRGVNIVHPDQTPDPEVLIIKVTRDEISYPSVRGEIWELENSKKKVGYVVMSSVGEHTEDMFRQEVQKMKGKVDSVIFDLRGNGGGFLQEAVKIGSYFLKKGDVIVKNDYRTHRDEVLFSRGYAGFQGLPMVVLVDGYTASAGEILALALREQAKAFIIGEKTFGKGTIQAIDELGDGASLKYTIGERLPPSGISINGTGAVPDLDLVYDSVQFNKDTTDNQIDAAKKHLDAILQ